MSSQDNNGSIIIILGVIILLSFFYLFNGKPIHNDGTLKMKSGSESDRHQESDNNTDLSNYSDNSSSNSDNNSNSSYDSDLEDQVAAASGITSEQIDEDDSADSSLEIIRERAMGMNGPYYRRKNGNRYKHNSYRALGAGTDLEKIDRHFKVEDVTKNYNDRFVPMDESYGENAAVDIKNNKGTERDKYNSDNFLPKQKEKDWFETIETVDVKNSHLINIYRPIGANTIGSSHKGAIYDLRGLDKAVCPKFVVSPFLQSSWEPDRSSKSLCA